MRTEKFCKGCRKTKPASGFYQFTRIGSLGPFVTLSTLCKPCHCKVTYAYMYANKDRMAAARLRRCSNDQERAKRRAYYWKTRDAQLKNARDSYYRDPMKPRARAALNRAVKAGKVIRKPCSICGDPKSQGHHSDYRKPLSVIWLCTTHHKDLHHPKRIVRRTIKLARS